MGNYLGSLGAGALQMGLLWRLDSVLNAVGRWQVFKKTLLYTKQCVFAAQATGNTSKQPQRLLSEAGPLVSWASSPTVALVGRF